jgi:hypothetical protein
MLDVSYPMENGIVRNWDDMGHIWDFTFGPDKLDIDPKVGRGGGPSPWGKNCLVWVVF